jgi:hypothetical protein
VRSIEPTQLIGRPGKSALRLKPCLLATHRKLQQIAASKLMQDWSPQQISGWLKSQHPNDESLRVSKRFIAACSFAPDRYGTVESGAQIFAMPPGG